MSTRIFHRCDEVVKMQSDAFAASPPPRPAASDVLAETPATASTHSFVVQPELEEIREELEELRRRRADLEAQRQRLMGKRLAGKKEQQQQRLRGGANSSASLTQRDGQPTTWSSTGLSSTHTRSEVESTTAVAISHGVASRHRYVDTTVLANVTAIPSEQSRRAHLHSTPQLDMKSAIRGAARHDSTLLMGDFLPEDNPHTCTFGRERRFRPVVGQRGRYYLGTDVGVEQLLNRNDGDMGCLARASRRFERTPGPGAYTPRYNKVSRPPQV